MINVSHVGLIWDLLLLFRKFLKSGKIWSLWEKAGPLFALILVITIFGILEPKNFLSYNNFSNVDRKSVV